MSEQLEFTSLPSSDNDQWSELENYEQTDLAPKVDNSDLAHDQLETVNPEDLLQIAYEGGFIRYCDLYQIEVPKNIDLPDTLAEDAKQCKTRLIMVVLC